MTPMSVDQAAKLTMARICTGVQPGCEERDAGLPLRQIIPVTFVLFPALHSITGQ